MAGSAQPSELTEMYSDFKQQVSNALSDLLEAGMVKFIQKDEVPPKRHYEITDFGWNSINKADNLTAMETYILKGKTYMNILQRLEDEIKLPSDIAQELKVTRSDISHHLRLLRKENLVDYEKIGKRRAYRITTRGKDLLDQNKDICM